MVQIVKIYGQIIDFRVSDKFNLKGLFLQVSMRGNYVYVIYIKMFVFMLRMCFGIDLSN